MRFERQLFSTWRCLGISLHFYVFKLAKPGETMMDVVMEDSESVEAMEVKMRKSRVIVNQAKSHASTTGSFLIRRLAQHWKRATLETSASTDHFKAV